MNNLLFYDDHISIAGMPTLVEALEDSEIKTTT